MLDGTFDHVFAYGFIACSLLRLWYTKGKRPKAIPKTEKLMLYLSAFGLAYIPASYLLTPWLDFADYYLPVWIYWVGTVLFAAAFCLLWRGHADLGHNFSPSLKLREGHTLVTRGVYRFIRHPIYSAHLLWGAAQLLLLHNLIAGPAMLIAVVPFYVYRIPREEKMMLEYFGEEYRDYMERTGQVVPYWR